MNFALKYDSTLGGVIKEKNISPDSIKISFPFICGIKNIYSNL